MRSLHTRALEVLARAAVFKHCGDEAEAGYHFADDQLHKTRHLADQLARVLHRDQQLDHVHARELSDNEGVAAEARTGRGTAIL